MSLPHSCAYHGCRSEEEASCRNRFGSESDKDGLCVVYLLGLDEAVKTTL